MAENNTMMEKIVSLCKRRGFVFPSSDIYGGFAATYDYGPLGFLLKKNIEQAWRRWNTGLRDDVLEIEGAIFMHPRVWEASGHVGGFADVLVEDLVTHKRYRADHLLEDAKIVENGGGLTLQETDDLIKANGLTSPEGNPLSSAKKFNQLVKTHLGATEDDTTLVYLKGESCQNIYLNFKLVQETMRMKLPFGIAQIGKTFRNEITVKNFLFRTREFEQMDVQYFCHPKDADRYYEEWRENRWKFYTEFMGFSKKNVRWRQHSPEERAFYAKDAWDVQYQFAEIGFQEVEGVHHRSDYDLTQHQKFSGTDLSYFDQTTGERFIPYIVECSGGFNRLFLATMFEAYREDGERKYLAFKPNIAPYKAAIFPLLANKPELVAKAREIYNALAHSTDSPGSPQAGRGQAIVPIAWDDRGNIGKRYFAQDEIGTPYCVTVDFQTLEDGTVTVRDRDTAAQERLPISELQQFLEKSLA